MHLEYKGEENEKLNDDDVAKLSEALIKNEKFVGPLDLSGNALTDLSALALAKTLEKKGGRNLTKLDLSDNAFSQLAGIYIGSALINNPEYPLYKLTFKNVCLGDMGLVRVLEGVNANKNIEKLHCGILTDN